MLALHRENCSYWLLVILLLVVSCFMNYLHKSVSQVPWTVTYFAGFYGSNCVRLVNSYILQTGLRFRVLSSVRLVV